MNLSESLYSLIELWYGWLENQSIAVGNRSLTERVIAIDTCETYMNDKYYLMSEIDESFKCLEKKN